MLGEEDSVLTEGPLVWALDDDPMILALLQDVFVGGGYRFQGFEHPDDLMEALRQPQGGLPHVFLIDLMLPGTHGAQVIRALNQDASCASIPKIVLTASALDGAMHNAFDAGADDFIRKPFNVMELNARVRVHLRAQRHRHRQRAHVDTIDTLLKLASMSVQPAQPITYLERARQVLLRASDAQAVECLHLQPEAGVLVPAQQPDGAHLSDLRDAPGLERALLKGQGVLLRARHSDVARWPMLKHMGASEEALAQGHLAFVPLMHDGAAVGALVALGTQRPEQLFELLERCAQVCATRVATLDALHRQAAHAQAMREVERTHTYLKQVLAASPHAIVAADRQGRILLFNQAASDILGWTKERGVGMSVERLYPLGQAREIMRKLRDATHRREGVLRQARQTLQDHQGDEIPVLLSAALLLDDSGQEIGTVGVFTDLRERLSLESKIERVRQRQAQQQQSDSSARNLLLGDLNQPLTSLLGYVGLLEAGGLDEDVSQRALGHIRASAQRLARMIEHPSLDPAPDVVNPPQQP